MLPGRFSPQTGTPEVFSEGIQNSGLEAQRIVWQKTGCKNVTHTDNFVIRTKRNLENDVFITSTFCPPFFMALYVEISERKPRRREIGTLEKKYKRRKGKGRKESASGYNFEKWMRSLLAVIVADPFPASFQAFQL